VRAFQVSSFDGADALAEAEVPEPPLSHPRTPGAGVLIEVRAVALSFPDVLMTQGRYQATHSLPFTPGGEVAGVVVESSDARFAPGDAVAALTSHGGLAERAVAPASTTFPVPPGFDFAEAAALVLNYPTAIFALATRGMVQPGDWVLVHGAGGGVGSASLQVAVALGARTIAVVSSPLKAEVARESGADEIIGVDQPWKDRAREISDGGVNVIVDPVGGDRFLDSIRALRRGGRVVVVGFAGGAIPEVKVNRLLLRNVAVVGAGLGEYLAEEPEVWQQISERLTTMIAAGRIRPIVKSRVGWAHAVEALKLIERGEALGKVVVERE
jgi:NADPH2:quinone reductase